MGRWGRSRDSGLAARGCAGRVQQQRPGRSVPPERLLHGKPERGLVDRRRGSAYRAWPIVKWTSTSSSGASRRRNTAGTGRPAPTGCSVTAWPSMPTASGASRTRGPWSIRLTVPTSERACPGCATAGAGTPSSAWVSLTARPPIILTLPGVRVAQSATRSPGRAGTAPLRGPPEGRGHRRACGWPGTSTLTARQGGTHGRGSHATDRDRVRCGADRPINQARVRADRVGRAEQPSASVGRTVGVTDERALTNRT